MYFEIGLLAAICGYCIWLVFCSLHPPLPGSDEEPRLYSNQCQQNLRTLYVEAIQQARQSIHLVMFGSSDAGIINALAVRIREELPTTIYYDANESTVIQSRLQHAHLHPIQLGGLMHQKIIILDHDLVFIGSANITSSSLLMHDNLGRRHAQRHRG